MSGDFKISDISGLTPAKVPEVSTASRAKLEKAAKEFEGIFMDMVMKSMRSTVEQSDVFGDTEKVKFFQDMLDTEYSQMTSKNAYGSLSEAIVKQLLPRIEAEEKAGIKPLLQGGSEL